MRGGRASPHEAWCSDGVVSPHMYDHRVIPTRSVVPARCNTSGSAVDPCHDAPVGARRAERVVDDGVVSVRRALSVSPRVSRINAQPVARFDPYYTRNCLSPKKLRRDIQ
jgi:hypothetical protein